MNKKNLYFQNWRKNILVGNESNIATNKVTRSISFQGGSAQITIDLFEDAKYKIFW